MRGIKLGIILALVLALAWTGYRYRAEIERAASLRANVAQYQRALDAQARATEHERTERQRIEHLLAGYETDRARIRTEAQQLRAEIETLRRTDEHTAQWSDQRLPAAIRDRLQQHADRRH